MSSPLVAILLLLAGWNFCLAEPDLVDSQCYVLNVTSEVALGWPFRVSCDEYVTADETLELLEDYVENELVPFACDIYERDDKVHSYNGSYNVSDDEFISEPHEVAVTENTTLTLIMRISDVCAQIRHRLVALDVNENSCSVYRENIEAVNGYVDKEIECDGELELDCAADPREPPIFLPDESYKITWYRDCEVLSNDSYTERTTRTSEGKLLSTIEVTGDRARFAGSYSCKISYNGMSRFLKHYQVCISQPRLDHIPGNVIKPRLWKVPANLGEDVVLECSGTGPLTRSDAFVSRQFRWYVRNQQGDSMEICNLTQTVGGSNKTVDGKYECAEISDARLKQKVCDSSPTCDEFDKMKEKFTTSLLIRRVAVTDFVTYYCDVKTTANTDNATVILQQAPDRPPVETFTIALAAVAGVLCFAMLCLVCWMAFKTHLRLLYKKYIASYDQDRLYAVYLAYSFHRDSDDDKTRSFLNALHNWLDANNYDVYNEQKDNANELRFESVVRIAPSCHRMVIVLTPRFFQNDEKFFEVQTGILNNISGKTRLIFILMPETRDFLKNKLKSKDASMCRSISAAMNLKQNTVILWKGFTHKSTFFKQLEIAMPKLRPNAYVISNSSIGSESDLKSREIGRQDRLRTVSSILDEMPDAIV